MNNVNRLIKNFLSSISGNLVGQAINFFIMMYLPRILGPDGYGIFNFSQSYVMYFYLICDLGLSLYCVREVNQNKQDEKEIINKIYTLKLYLSIISTIIFYVTIIFISKSIMVKYALICVGFSIFFTGITIDYLFNALSDMKYSGIYAAIKNIIFGLLCFLFIKSKNDVFLASLFYTVSLGLAQIYLFIKFRNKYFKLKIVKLAFLDINILRGALPLAISLFMVQINNNFDIVYLSFTKTQREVGYYSAPYKIINFLIAILCIYFNAAYPTIAQLLKNDRNELNQYIYKFYTYGAMVVIPIIFGGIALNDKIINFLFGSQYNPSIILFSILLPLIFIRLVTSTYGAVLIMGEGSKYFSKGVIMGAIINVILNIILTPHYGAKGSAVATLICESIQGVYLFVQYRRYCDSRFVYSNIRFLICSFIMLLVLIYIKCNLFLAILLGIAIYFSILCLLNILLKIFKNHKRIYR